MNMFDVPLIERLFPSLQVHALIMSELKESMPSMFGKDSKRKELINVRRNENSFDNHLGVSSESTCDLPKNRT